MVFLFMEIWKDIEGYEGYYQVSNLGRVKSLERKVRNTLKSYRIIKERILKPTPKKEGYLDISLNISQKRKHFYVHRLVASHFIGNPEKGMDVNHKDGNKKNNNVDNLEWLSRAENHAHAYKKLKRQGSRAILTKEQVLDIIKLHKEGISMKLLSEMYKVKYHTIKNALSDKYYNY